MLRSLILALALLAVAACTAPAATTQPTLAPTLAPATAEPTEEPTIAPTIAPATAEPSAAAGTTVSVAEGGFFVGPDGLSLYTFDNDEPDVSNCEGECLANWPALSV